MASTISTVLAAAILVLAPVMVWLEIREWQRRRELIRNLDHSAAGRELTIHRAEALLAELEEGKEPSDG